MDVRLPRPNSNKKEIIAEVPYAYNIDEKVLDKLRSLARPQVFKRVLKEVEDTLSSMKGVLLDADEQQAENPQLRDWLRRLKVVCYEPMMLMMCSMKLTLQEIETVFSDWLNLKMSSVSSTSSSSSTVADLLVRNAIIYTSDVSLPFADSMAVRNGRILGVGNYSSVKDLAGYETQELNLEGKVVVPGFIDSHVHFIFGGLQESAPFIDWI